MHSIGTLPLECVFVAIKIEDRSEIAKAIICRVGKKDQQIVKENKLKLLNSCLTIMNHCSMQTLNLKFLCRAVFI